MRVVLLGDHLRLKSSNDDFGKLLGHRDGPHADNELIDLAIFVESHLIDRLKEQCNQESVSSLEMRLIRPMRSSPSQLANTQEPDRCKSDVLNLNLFAAYDAYLGRI